MHPGPPREPPAPLRSLCVYCASSNDVAEHYFAAARHVGTTLAERGITVIFGGGRVGLMGAVADAALSAGGQVIGVIPRKLMDLEVGHDGLTELHVVQDMHVRKGLMAELSDGFVALPGGWGTLEELAEAATWRQLNYHLKPVGLLNVAGFFDPLVAFLDQAIEQGFVRSIHRDLVLVETRIETLLDRLQTSETPRLASWSGG